MKGQSHSQLIYIEITPAQAAATEILIPDQPLLRFARVTAMEAFVREDLVWVPPTSSPTITAAMLPKITLTLNTNNPEDPSQNVPNSPGRFSSTDENFKYIPLVSLHRTQSTANTPFVRQLFETFNVYPSWDKCKLNIAPGGLGNGETVCVALQVYYSWLTIDGKKITR